MARLFRLGPAKEVAQIAAVIGEECTYALFALDAADLVVDLDRALNDLVAAGLFLRRGQPPDAIYFFRHALLQDLAYGALLRERKRALHARIAAVCNFYTRSTSAPAAFRDYPEQPF